MPRKRFKTALVLSGGSARGLAHVGVLDELEKTDIPIDMIVGTSMGAVVGGLYAYHRDITIVIDKMRKLLESDLFLKTIALAKDDAPETGPDGFFNRFMWLFRRGVYYTHSIIKPTLVEVEVYEEIMANLIPDHPMEELSIPCAAVAMDIASGEEVVLTKGSLQKAVSASAAIPGLLPPRELYGRTLVDGGWVDNIPVVPAIALGSHFVIAVDAALDVEGLGVPPASAIESLFRCNEITRITLMQERESHADVILTPQIGQLFWANFACMDRCFTYGSDVLRESIPTIKRARQKRLVRTMNGWLHPARTGKWRHHMIIY